jgi:hypothetical protein
LYKEALRMRDGEKQALKNRREGGSLLLQDGCQEEWMKIGAAQHKTFSFLWIMLEKKKYQKSKGDESWEHSLVLPGLPGGAWGVQSLRMPQLPPTRCTGDFWNDVTREMAKAETLGRPAS